MLIERTKKEVIIRLPASVNIDDFQDFLNYARYKELTSTFNVSKKAVDKIVNKINANYQKVNRKN
jgi:hypothetical protein